MYPMKKVACESSFNPFQRGAEITDYHRMTQFVDLSTIHSLDISFARKSFDSIINYLPIINQPPVLQLICKIGVVLLGPTFLLLVFAHAILLDRQIFVVLDNYF
ncbi:hypothetical protein T09_1985 [Trichinella sp. T9]|nr:hypothetical protein T09_1985 [Trichinella sp. T9]